MITGFEIETVQLNDDEIFVGQQLLNFLETCVGKEHAVNSPTLIDMFENNKHKFGDRFKNFKLNDVRIRKIINYLRNNNLISCLCSTSSGYYVAENQTEMYETLKSLKERIDSQSYTFNQLKRQYMDRFPPQPKIKNENNLF
jgi:hypothetical protein